MSEDSYALKLLTDTEDRKKSFLNDIWSPLLCGTLGFGAACFVNFGTRRPIFSGKFFFLVFVASHQFKFLDFLVYQVSRTMFCTQCSVQESAKSWMAGEIHIWLKEMPFYVTMSSYIPKISQIQVLDYFCLIYSIHGSFKKIPSPKLNSIL